MYDTILRCKENVNVKFNTPETTTAMDAHGPVTIEIPGENDKNSGVGPCLFREVPLQT